MRVYALLRLNELSRYDHFRDNPYSKKVHRVQFNSRFESSMYRINKPWEVIPLEQLTLSLYRKKINHIGTASQMCYVENELKESRMGNGGGSVGRASDSGSKHPAYTCTCRTG